ncbi:MAG: hypothetical protein U1A23_00755, partial [Candidatus Sungbacteria bacterium]|nr:hypothetical protein [Candidatus Sungbacteria bacterium]
QKRAKVEKFVHGRLLAEEQVRALFQNTSTPAYAALLKGAGELFNGDLAAKEIEGLYADGKTVGYRGNVSFFTNPSDPRNFSVLGTEIQKALVSVGLITKVMAVEHAKWDYAKLAKGLVDISAAEASKFNPKELAKHVDSMDRKGLLDKERLFVVEIPFDKDKAVVDPKNLLIRTRLLEVLERAVTYGGAGVTIEAHADVSSYLDERATGAPPDFLKKKRHVALGLSRARAMAVKKMVVDLAESEGLLIDPNQFVVVGYGIEKPKTGMCGTDPCMPADDEAKQSNRRVEFRFLEIPAESSVFAGK